MGRVAAPYGVHGWVRLRVFTAAPDGLAHYPVWWLGNDGAWNEWTLEDAMVRGHGLAAKLAGCEERTAAEKLQGLDVAVPRSDLPRSAAGEYYWSDLIGLEVANRDGVSLGRVETLMETGANDVLVVRGERERLIPFIDPVIVEVDLESGRLLVDWAADY